MATLIDSSARRLVAAGAAGVVAGGATAAAGAPAVLVGLAAWVGAAACFLAIVGSFVLRVDGPTTARVAGGEDDSRRTSHLLLVGASLASLVGVTVALASAGDDPGRPEALLTGGALLTIVVSWLVVNAVYTLRYAHLYFRPPVGGIDFAGVDVPDYRDFAYLALTIGMTYQVADTGLRAPRFRRAVLGHALLSYLFATVIVAAAINMVAGLLH